METKSFTFFVLVIALFMMAFSTPSQGQPPFEVPPSGGLPICTEDLNTCNMELDECEAQESFGVAQTGQTTCWNQNGVVLASCVGTGQDGDIQAGAMPPSPRFTDHSDGTITDNFTGLMWLKDGNCPNAGRTWSQALGDVTSLNNSQMMNGNPCYEYTATYTDWYLPNRNQLESLLDLENFLPSLPTGHLFWDFKYSHYWSSTAYAWIPSDAWTVVYDFGRVETRTKNQYGLWVIAVRDGQ